MEFNHKSVLLQECIDGLNIRKNKKYVDGTLGGAGHSKEIAKKLENTGMLIGIDRDEDALNVAKERLSEFTNIKFVHNNHDNIKEILEELHPEVDFETCETLIDDKILDSFDIISIISEVNDVFDVTISAEYIIPDNFNSAKALYALIEKLEDEE